MLTRAKMTMETDFLEFSTLLQNISTMMYKSTQSAEMLLFYFNALADEMNIDQFKAALMAHTKDVKDCKFFPQPGLLLSQHKRISEQGTKQSWLRVVNAVRLIGKNRTVTFDDPKIHAAIQSMGGWVHLCETLNVDDSRSMARFVDAMNSSDITKAPVLLLGVADVSNASNGIKVKSLPFKVPGSDSPSMQSLPLISA